MESRPTKILVVDDDATFRGRLVRALSSRGYETLEAGDVEGAQAAMRAHLATVRRAYEQI